MAGILNNMKMVALAACLGIGSAFAGNILTYTATSKVSQKDADQKALDGVAKQIRTQVRSSFEVSTKEKADGSVSEETQSFKGSYTDVMLKGAKITVGPQVDGKFQSTVTLDVDMLTSKIMADLDVIRDKMKALDVVIRKALQDGDYRKASAELLEMEKLGDSYNAKLEELSMFKVIDKSLRLESTLAELLNDFETTLSSVKIEANIDGDNLMITVSDYTGPIPYFPVVVIQDRKDLLKSKTDDNGELSFPMKKVRSKKPSGEVKILADLNFKFLHKTAVTPTVVSYGAAAAACSYRLKCTGGTAECGALQKFLNDAGIKTVDKSSLPTLKATLTFSDKENGKLFTSKGTVVLNSDESQLTLQPQGVGRDEESAHTKAISKMNASKVADAFANKCPAK
ncbi:hypothetical protein [Treponema sp.]|uniref:hypothetical protein n=1 Tax=Treponema sp. TaxID=166 RepID=UPI00298E6667|nr:hypothetical protein [Treponema sp.]MCQ2242548.1 hypothetical protein [Treponema sp.]